MIKKILLTFGIGVGVILALSFASWLLFLKLYFEKPPRMQLPESDVEIVDRMITIKNLRVRYYTAGDPSKPKLIVLHGSGGSFELANYFSQKILRELGKEFYVYLPEHPGMRRSEAPNESWKLEDYREYVEEFVDSLGIEKPVVMGQSFGGALALVYAGSNPDKVKLLVVGDPATTFGDLSVYERLLVSLARPAGSFLRSRLIPVEIKKFIVRYAVSVPEELINDNDFEKYALMVSAYENFKGDYTRELKSISVPTIIVWGSRDKLIPLKQGEKLRQLLSNSRLVVFDAGHTAMYGHINEVIDLVKEGLSVDNESNQ